MGIITSEISKIGAKANWEKRRNNLELDNAIRQHQSDTRKRLWQDPEYRKMMISHQKKKTNEEMELMMKKRWENKERLIFETRQCKNCQKDFQKKINGYQAGPYKGIYCSSKCARLYQVFPVKDTKIEMTLQNKLSVNNIIFKKHVAIIGQPDIFIEPNICIFADGCYWHGCERCFDRNKMNSWQLGRKVKDMIITQKLINNGYSVIRFWEHEINEYPDGVISQISEKIRVVGVHA